MVADSSSCNSDSFWHYDYLFPNIPCFSLCLYAFLMNQKEEKIRLFLKIFFLFLTSIFICFLTYRFCYFIAEKYFFDKFFYQKSVIHGYFPSNNSTQFSDFGDRSKDLISLDNSKLKGDPKKYKIVIIGDSHVWGQGIRNEQRFAKLLKNKLNKIRPTEVFSLGKLGYNTLDYSQIMIKSSSFFSADLYIVLPVTNDAIINNENQNSPILLNCQKQFPDQTPLYFLQNDQLSNNNLQNYISDQINLSWQNPINTCVVNESLKLFPASKTIFLIDKNYNRDNQQFEIYQQLIYQNNKYQISTEVGKFMNNYKKYFKDNTYSNFEVSPSDPHPNTLANQMYTDILFDEIITNPQWNFIHVK